MVATHQLRIGSLNLSSKLLLAPLERVSDVGFRKLCFQQGAALTWTEMIYASDFAKQVAVITDDSVKCSSAALALVDTHDAETLTGVQFLVDRTTAKDQHGVDTLKRALEALETGAFTHHPEWKDNICAIDLNFGCPSLSIIRRGAGPGQLRRKSHLRNIFQAMREWQRTTSLTNVQAIGAKIRLGINENEQKTHKVFLNVAEAAVDAGLDYLAVHAKHAQQRSRDEPCWEAIAEIKEFVLKSSSSMAVIGNGHVCTASDVQNMLNRTGCDGVMIGRAAMNNPWIFRDCEYRPTTQQVQDAQTMYKIWSSNRPAYNRYRSFHEENFARLLRESHLC